VSTEISKTPPRRDTWCPDRGTSARESQAEGGAANWVRLATGTDQGKIGTRSAQAAGDASDDFSWILQSSSSGTEKTLLSNRTVNPITAAGKEGGYQEKGTTETGPGGAP